MGSFEESVNRMRSSPPMSSFFLSFFLSRRLFRHRCSLSRFRADKRRGSKQRAITNKQRQRETGRFDFRRFIFPRDRRINLQMARPRSAANQQRI